MKYIGLLILLLLWGGCTQRVPQSTWYTLKVDEQCTVQLPAKPQEMNVSAAMSAAQPQRQQDAMVKSSRVYKLEDTSALYVVIRIPLAEKPVLPPTFEERKSYYIGRAIPLMLRKEYPNLLEQSVTEQDGVDMLTVKYKTFAADGSLVIKYIRNFTVGNVVYQLHFLPLRQSGDFKEAERLQFFNSIQVQQPTTH